MGRAIVLICCLVAAAGIAGYTHYAERKAGETPVYTVMVPQRPPEPAVQPQAAPVPPIPPKAIATPGDRASLARELQRELKRVGCYGGEINGVWTTSSRMAMKAFTDQVNASLPIDNPDYILLSLVQGRQDTVCRSTEAKAPAPVEKPAPQVTEKSPPPGEKSTATIGAAVPAAAAAVTALVATAPQAGPKLDPKVSAPEDRARPAAVSPPPAEPPPKTQADRTARGPVPPAGVYERRSRRYATYRSRPPRFVRNFLRTLGFR